MRKSILLLGGNGYIGSRVYDHLYGPNYNVTNVDLCWFGKIFDNTIQQNYNELSKEFINGFTHVILLAAHSSVNMCKGSLLPCFENNVLNFIKLIEKLNDDQVLIYSSTAAVYGNNKNLVDESYPIAGGISYYDYTKICNENIISLYPNKKILGLRFGSIGGFSKNFRGENLLNSISMSSLKSNEITITNPENYRSVLGMSDLCRVFSTILAEDTIKNKIYNITSINAKIIEFAQDIQRRTNCKLIVSDKFPTNYSFNCDNSLFQNDYGFKFQDNVASIYDEIITNRDFIISNVLRENV